MNIFNEKKKILRSQTTSRSPYEGSYKKITVFQTRKRKEQDWEITKCGNLMNKNAVRRQIQYEGRR